MSETKETALVGLNLQQLTEMMVEAGEPAYRGRQLFEAIYQGRTGRIDDISTLPRELRKKMLEDGAVVGFPRVRNKFVSTDGTVRYLLAMADGQTVEAVWMPEGDGGEAGDGSEAGSLTNDAPTKEASRKWDRATICISSQVGCAVDCQFCLTALLGVKRNLSAGEIAGQVCTVLENQDVRPPQDRVNLVFMGMGEPFLNYENFMQSVHLLVDGVGIPESRMTVSTAGIVPRIADFGNEPVRPKLAISLNAPNDELRSRIMPLNRKWNLEMLLAAAREFPLRPRERLTFEYVLLDGINDAAEQARELAELVRGIRAKVNLIALNPGPGISFGTPSADRVLKFQSILVGQGIPTFIRRPRGRDIFAACGQLKATADSGSA
ncbi:MAG TPA: 23S rRNA (adenine(2503)-C(2))-methyltransferase RlmN [Terriglobales bacterium]